MWLLRKEMNLNLHFIFFQLFMGWGNPYLRLFHCTLLNHQGKAEGKVTQHFLQSLMVITAYCAELIFIKDSYPGFLL